MPKFQVEVVFELEAADEDDAFRQVDGMLEQAWENDHAGGVTLHQARWHYEMLEGCVGEIG